MSSSPSAWKVTVYLIFSNLAEAATSAVKLLPFSSFSSTPSAL